MRSARVVPILSVATLLAFEGAGVDSSGSDASDASDAHASPTRVGLAEANIGVSGLKFDSDVLTRRYASTLERPGVDDRSPPDISHEALTAVVHRLCGTCHNDQLRTGNLSLTSFYVDSAAVQAETAEKMVRKLRAGMMPPPGIPRPGGDTLLALVEALESVVDEAASVEPDLGVRRFQRLNRAEYEQAIRDLVMLDVDAAQWLPPDTYLGSFANQAAAQALTVTSLEGYMRAAADVSRMAVGNADAVATTTTYRNPIELSQHSSDHLEGAPFGTRGGIVVTHHFPADGEYVFSVETLFGSGTSFQDLDISIDGKPVAVLRLEHNGENTVPIQTEPIFVRAGQHQVAAAFIRHRDGPYEDRFSPFEWSFVGGEDSQDWANYGITALPHVDQLLIAGPTRVTGVSETPSRQAIFTCRPASPADGRACAESIISRLATAAYRRPIAAEDLTRLMTLYDRASAEEGFEIGVRTALQAILASPQFLFRLEEQPRGVQPDEGYRLSDLALATRLSYFLWATAPDDELVELAASGQLSESNVLDQQVERMLADPRSEALATRFAHQWLQMQDVGKNQPEPFLYPNFSGQLSDAMVRETELLFNHVVREDRSLLELFNADYTFVNERLARHYGIDGISGSEFRRVEYPDDSQRRGILGHGSVLQLTSMPGRTSPVLRGKWVMTVLMGTPPPPPPPNVPAFEATEGAAEGRILTTKERLEIHRANPTCNACHRFMDPIGLALEHFDATGRLRIRDNMIPLDTRGTFYDGTAISTPRELVQVLLKRPIPLVRNFTENLMAYAIGRPMEYYDQPAIRSITSAARANDYRMSSFIKGVVRSEPFQMSRSSTEFTAADGGI